MTRKLYLLFVFAFLSMNLSAQEYAPFPTETATWNGFLQQTGWNSAFYNYSYLLDGDTLINELNYSKVYYSESGAEYSYIGGLREDASKNIYFYASEPSENVTHLYFPELETEYHLYAFDNLEVDMEVPLEEADGIPWPYLVVENIDSVLVQGDYRKRYEIDGVHWIEGIGSTKDLFNHFAYELAGGLNSLCYTDSEIGTYLFEPYDSCSMTLSINELNPINFKIFPNPVINEFTFESDHFFRNGSISILNSFGQTIIHDTFNGYVRQLNGENLTKGMYFILIQDEDQEIRARFLKQ